MAKLFNRAKMTTSTTGSGTVTLSAAAGGFQSFADAGVSNGDVVQYLIEEGSAWEIGTGTYSSTGTSLTRTPSESSDGGTAITLGGAANVAITAVADDLNRLQHEGSTKVSVSATGASVTGALTTSGDLTVNGEVAADLSFGDNVKAKFGASDDLQIYHSGSHSYISDTGQGNLTITAGNFYLNNAADNQNMISAINGGATSIMYNGGTKLATTSTGIDVTGTVTADGLTVDGNATLQGTGDVTLTLASDTDNSGEDDSPTIIMTQDGGSHYGHVGVNGQANTKFTGAVSNTPYIYSGVGFQVATNAKVSARPSITVGSTGDISFYEDTGTTAKFFWDASAESLGIGTTSPTSYAVYGYGPSIELSGGYGGSVIVSDTSQTNKTVLTHFGSSGEGILKTTTSKSLHFSTNDSAPMMTIDSSGNVGIGTSSPNDKVDISGSTGDGYRLTDGTHTGVFRSISGGTILKTTTNHALIFCSNDTERMRIDSSWNLLVVTTDSAMASASGGNEGIKLDGSQGQLQVTSVSDVQMYLNRQSTDGEIAVFRKDGTTVGSIGTASGYSTIGSGDTGLIFHSGDDAIYGWNTSTNAARGSAIDLGTNTRKFKDAHFSGTVNAANFNTTSDATLKTNVETLTGSLDAVKALRGVSYDWIDSGNSEVGVIAQEVEAVVPDVVSTNDQGIKSVKYGNLVGVLIEAIKEQQQRIEALEAKLNS